MHLAKRIIAAATIGSALLVAGCIIKGGTLFAPQNTFFYEDFSGVSEGALPDGWTGSDNLLVGRAGRSKALYISSDHDVTETALTPPIAFPEDFRIELVVAMPTSSMECKGGVSVQVGSAVAAIRDGCGASQQVIFNGDIADEYARTGNNNVFVLEKKGDAFSVLVNGKRFHLKRLSKFDQPDRLGITLKGSRGQVLLLSVSGTPLGSSKPATGNTQASAR